MPFSSIPRTPFSTQSMSRDAMKAVERAADVRTSTLLSSAPSLLVVKNVLIDEIFYADSASMYDAPLNYNCDETNAKALRRPTLGDRVVNLNAQGVPFALRGTVITIHEKTGYVEVLFDEEFTGGKSLQGSCSAFRGRYESILGSFEPGPEGLLNCLLGSPGSSPGILGCNFAVF